MNRSMVYRERSGSQDQVLYDHFLELVEQEAPDRLLERFKLLFMDGMGYPDRTITKSLEELIGSSITEQEFAYLLNRCCHILINRWQLSDRHSSAILQLIDLLGQPPVNKSGTLYRSRNLTRLHQLLHTFQESEQYLTLTRLAQVVENAKPPVQPVQTQPLGQLISRYPYLYDHCLVSEDSDYQHQNRILKLRCEHQQTFEKNLSLYLTYQVRRSHLAQRGVRDTTQIQQLLTPVENPTFLNNRELSAALRQYAGKVNQKQSYQDMARQFSAHTSQGLTFGKFKGDLYQYITGSIGSDYSGRTFSRKLTQHLQQISRESEASRLTDFLVVRTCSQVINFMVVESPRKLDHFVLMDLLSNLGTLETIGLLLKLSLFCNKVKPYLEKRLSILFTHYETSTQEAMLWLIHTLEHMHLALTTNFGALQLPFRV
ncbi:hypothetical protein [Prochlorothrix hollandica]|uniref:Uncharacterized protein n=1 Tax=Prochlorothrix hollandica PCC 9006 = CALU 1027 TaxID=317619 RepID=A0A0M2PSN7_PROHO|nr:hypothetical protein [Prochlorothrix hollandica]KKI98177.1 hypothetical protein PROH_21065 [Prochlorothrix hollandica PCC 9006 = CALU 1027]